MSTILGIFPVTVHDYKTEELLLEEYHTYKIEKLNSTEIVF